MTLLYFKRLNVLFLIPVCLLSAQEAAESSIKDEFKTFMRNEGDSFFASMQPYYNSKKLLDDVLRIKEKIMAIQDSKLQQLLNTPSGFFVIPQMLGNKLDHVTLEQNYEKISEEILKFLFSARGILSNYPFTNNTDREKVINIFSNQRRLFLKVTTERKLLKSCSDFCLQIGKNYKNLNNFIEKISKANNLTTPKIYITQDDEASFFNLKLKSLSLEQPVIILSTSLFKNYDEDSIKGVILHELGHHYYNDQERCAMFAPKLTPEKNLNYNYFKEYRADLFAATYGFGPGISNYFGKYLRGTEGLANITNPFEPHNFTHPSSLYRINYLKNLPTNQSFKQFGNTLYPLIYEPYFKKYGTLNPTEKHPVMRNILGLEIKPRLNQMTNINLPGKIVNTSAQPIRPTAAQATQAAVKALQVVKRAPK